MAYAETERRLTNIAFAIGKNYGFTAARVEVRDYSNPMKVTWQRAGSRIYWQVSPYLVRIPDDIAVEIFGNMYRHLKKRPVPDYSPRVKKWIANAKKRAAAKKSAAPFGL